MKIFGRKFEGDSFLTSWIYRKRRRRATYSLLAGGYWGFHRGKPVPFGNRAPSWIFEARDPGYGRASAKIEGGGGGGKRKTACSKTSSPWVAAQRPWHFRPRATHCFSPSPRPPPLAHFVNSLPDPDLAARIQDGDLITNSGFFRPSNRLRAGYATYQQIIVVKRGNLKILIVNL